MEQETERNATGHKKRSVWVVTVAGTILPDKGSPRSDGSFWTLSNDPPDETVSQDAKLASFRAKQGALCELMCRERKWLEWQPLDGSIATKCQPRIRSKSFQEGTWTSRCDYSFVFEADSVFFGTVECCAADSDLDPCDESWDVEQADDAGRTYRLVHSVGATFRDLIASDGSVTTEGWQRAKTAVEARMGLTQSKITQSGVLNLTTHAAYNHARSVSENRSEGTYRVTESWLCYDPAGGAAAVEDYTITTRAQAGRSTVSVEGSIQGLHVRDSNFAITTTKYASAAAKWAAVELLIFSRAQASSGLTLNPQALSLQVARNELTGVINYTAEWDDRFTFGSAISLDITVQDQLAADVFASIPVVARPAGPVPQDIGSTTETSRTVNVRAQFGALGYGGVAVQPDLSALLLLYRPVASTIFVARNETQWEVVAGSYSHTTTWVFQG